MNLLNDRLDTLSANYLHPQRMAAPRRLTVVAGNDDCEISDSIPPQA